MKIFTLVVAFVVGAITPGLVKAQQAPPFTPDKQFSADEVTASAQGVKETKINYDNGKVRAEAEDPSSITFSIIRPDESKTYAVLSPKKIVLVMPLTSQTTQQANLINSDSLKFELVGPDTINGVACTKYQATSSTGQMMFWWVNAADKTPVRIASSDGKKMIDIKNYKAGPQDPSLFEPPAGYTTVQVPNKNVSGAPGGPSVAAPAGPGAPPGQ